MQQGKDKLVQIEGVGEQTADSLVEYFQDPATAEMIERLQQAGLVIEAQGKSRPSWTGEFSCSRAPCTPFHGEEAKHLAKTLGAQVATSMSQRVTDVVAGEKAGGKRKQAEQMGLPILSEQQFGLGRTALGLMERKRMHALVHGRVQRVAFREHTRRKAERRIFGLGAKSA